MTRSKIQDKRHSATSLQCTREFVELPSSFAALSLPRHAGVQSNVSLNVDEAYPLSQERRRRHAVCVVRGCYGGDRRVPMDGIPRDFVSFLSSLIFIFVTEEIGTVPANKFRVILRQP
jgi:hypothetical protein